VFIGASLVLAACTGKPAVAIDHAWARATPPGSTVTAVYAQITSSRADEIVSIATPAAERVEMHRTSQVDGVMQMRAVGTMSIPANEPVKFEPGGLHLMLIGLHSPLIAGQHIDMTFEFRSAAAVTVAIEVLSPADVPHH
jgi:copper(I)-binding protein